MTLEHATFFSCRKVVVLKVAAVKKSRRMTKDRWATLAGEFLRYVVVGGLAFVVDLGALVLAQELLFGNFALGVYWATALGFVVGLTVNYALSLRFVFTQEKDRGKGRTVSAFLVFGLIGLLGLWWTELGMWIGVSVLGGHYVPVKIVVTGVVLLLNYLGRKILIFNREGVS